MALNKFMHPRNPFYNNPPDFFKLAAEYPEFSKFCKFDDGQKCSIDFRDPEALKSLCCILLNDLYGLNIDIPSNHLIPRVPQRLNYILWLEDLFDQHAKLIGIDIGCGTSCVYGLIACSLNKEWKIIGSDISEENIFWSLKNIQLNNLEKNIFAIRVDEDSIFTDLISKIDNDPTFPGCSENLDFTMCNPPFFSNESEHLGRSNIRKPTERPLPDSVNTGKMHESVYDKGGEVAFVKKMIDESILIGKRIKVYTTMLGKKSSFVEIKNYLVKEKNILNISVTQFCQGHTMRWAIAWSFHEVKLNNFDYKTLKEKEMKKSRMRVFKPFTIKIDKNRLEHDVFSMDRFHDVVKEFYLRDLKFELLQESKQRLVFKVLNKTWMTRKEKRKEIVQGQSSVIQKLDQNFSFVCSIEDTKPGFFEITLNLNKNFEKEEFNNYLSGIYEFTRHFFKCEANDSKERKLK